MDGLSLSSVPEDQDGKIQFHYFVNSWFEPKRLVYALVIGDKAHLQRMKIHHSLHIGLWRQFPKRNSKLL